MSSCVGRGFTERGEIGVDLQEAAGGELLIREPQRAEREVVRLLHADVDEIDTGARQLVEPCFERRERIVRPVGARQVGEDVDFAAVIGLQLEPIDRVAERVFERADDRAGVEPLDPQLGRALVRFAAAVAAGTIDHGHGRVGRQLLEQPAGQLAGFFEPRLVFVQVRHPQRIVEHERRGDRAVFLAGGAGAAERRPGERERQAGRSRRSAEPSRSSCRKPQPVLVDASSAAARTAAPERQAAAPRAA